MMLTIRVWATSNTAPAAGSITAGPRRRPVRVRAVTVPVEPLAMAPGTVAPHPAFKGCVGWGANAAPSRLPRGWAKRPAAARLSPASAAAGPELVGATR